MFGPHKKNTTPSFCNFVTAATHQKMAVNYLPSPGGRMPSRESLAGGLNVEQLSYMNRASKHFGDDEREFMAELCEQMDQSGAFKRKIEVVRLGDERLGYTAVCNGIVEKTMFGYVVMTGTGEPVYVPDAKSAAAGLVRALIQINAGSGRFADVDMVVWCQQDVGVLATIYMHASETKQ